MCEKWIDKYKYALLIYGMWEHEYVLRDHSRLFLVIARKGKTLYWNSVFSIGMFHCISVCWDFNMVMEGVV